MSVLQTIDLKKYYGTEPNITRALDGVNFSVEDGELLGIEKSAFWYCVPAPGIDQPGRFTVRAKYSMGG